MDLTRRSAMALGAGAMIAAVLPVPVFAAVEETIAEFTGGAATVEGGITLDTPEIAENGNTVPVSVSAPGAAAILIIATGNPLPPVATFNFGPLAARQEASTRMRLAATQDVIAIARMNDGSFLRTDRTIKVTIGGCGG